MIPSSVGSSLAGRSAVQSSRTNCSVFGDYQTTRQKNGVSNQETIPTLKSQDELLDTTEYCDFSDYACR